MLISSLLSVLFDVMLPRFKGGSESRTRYSKKINLGRRKVKVSLVRFILVSPRIEVFIFLLQNKTFFKQFGIPLDYHTSGIPFCIIIISYVQQKMSKVH